MPDYSQFTEPETLSASSSVQATCGVVECICTEDLRKQKNSSENSASDDRDTLCASYLHSPSLLNISSYDEILQLDLLGQYNKRHSVYLRKFIFVPPPGWLQDRTCVQDSSIKAPPVGIGAVVYVAVRTRAGIESSHGSITGRGKGFLSYAVGPEGLWGPPSLIFREYWGMFALLGCYTTQIGSYLPSFRHNPSFPPSSFKQSRKNISLVKQPRRKADHSFPSEVEIMNAYDAHAPSCRAQGQLLFTFCFKIRQSAFLKLGRVAQSEQRLTTGWTVWGSNPGGGEIFRPSRLALGLTQPPVQWVPGLSRG